MFKSLKRSHVIFLLGLSLLLAACGAAQQSWSGLTKTDNGELFVSYEDFIAKLDANGDQVWTYPAEDERRNKFFAGVTYTDDAVYIGDYAGGVHAIDRETGDSIWNYREGEPTRLFGFISFGGSTDRVIAPLTVGNSHLFVPDEHGIFMLDRETGKRITFDGEEDNEALLLETTRAVWSQPLFLPASEGQPERLIVSSLDHYVYSLNLEDGSLLWKRDVDGAVASAPTLNAAQDTLFVGTFNSEVVALNLENGEILDRFEADGWVWDAPAYADEMLYVADLSGYVYALSFAEGQFTEVWKKRLVDGKIRPQPMVLDNLLIVATEKSGIYALNRDNGDQEWHKEVDARLLSSLLTLEGSDDGEAETLIVTATDNRDRLVMAFSAENGNTRWEYEHKD